MGLSVIAHSKLLFFSKPSRFFDIFRENSSVITYLYNNSLGNSIFWKERQFSYLNLDFNVFLHLDSNTYFLKKIYNTVILGVLCVLLREKNTYLFLKCSGSMEWNLIKSLFPVKFKQLFEKTWYMMWLTGNFFILKLLKIFLTPRRSLIIPLSTKTYYTLEDHYIVFETIFIASITWVTVYVKIYIYFCKEK